MKKQKPVKLGDTLECLKELLLPPDKTEVRNYMELYGLKKEETEPK